MAKRTHFRIIASLVQFFETISRIVEIIIREPTRFVAYIMILERAYLYVTSLGKSVGLHKLLDSLKSALISYISSLLIRESATRSEEMDEILKKFIIEMKDAREAPGGKLMIRHYNFNEKQKR